MAGAGYKLFNTGDVLTAAQVNTYLQEQAVMRFANSTARTTALSGVLAEGMVSYLDDTNAVEVYNGSAWVGVSGTGDVTEVQAGTGISVASGTGPIPVVTNSMATAIDAKGDLIVGTGADTFTRLAVGATNGHTLQVDSSTSTGLKWAAVSSTSGMTFITRQTFSAVATADIDTIFSSTYETYLMVVEECFSSVNSRLLLQFRYAGPNTQTADYYGRLSRLAQTYSATDYGGVSSVGIIENIGTSASQASNGHFYFTNVGNGSRAPIAHGIGMPAGYLESSTTGFFNLTAREYTGVRLSAASGNLSARVAVYGLAKS